MEYIVGICVFIAGLIFVIVSARLIKGNFTAPLVASLGLMAAGIGLVIDEYLRINYDVVNFAGSKLIFIADWFPIGGLVIAAIAVLAIVVQHYKMQNQNYQPRSRKKQPKRSADSVAEDDASQGRFEDLADGMQSDTESSRY